MATTSDKEILVRNGEKLELKTIFKTTYPTVRSALRFKTNTALAHTIREAAIKRGGMLVKVEQYQSPIL